MFCLLCGGILESFARLCSGFPLRFRLTLPDKRHARTDKPCTGETPTSGYRLPNMQRFAALSQYTGVPKIRSLPVSCPKFLILLDFGARALTMSPVCRHNGLAS